MSSLFLRRLCIVRNLPAHRLRWVMTYSSAAMSGGPGSDSASWSATKEREFLVIASTAKEISSRCMGRGLGGNWHAEKVAQVRVYYF